MKLSKIVLSLLLLLFSLNLSAQDRDISYMTSGGEIHPIQANMDIRHYTINLDVDIENESINGFTEVTMLLEKPSDSLLLDLIHFLKVNSVSVNGETTAFFQKKDYLYIVNKNSFQAGKQLVKIDYGGKPPVAIKPPWDGGFTWTQDKSGNPWIAINCQGEGGKIYFPCKDHPSDEPNEGVDLFISVPTGLKVASFGLLQSKTSLPNNKTQFHWKTNYTISNYCVVFNVAKYHVEKRMYTTIDNNEVPMEFYILEEDKEHANKVLDIRERDARVLEKYLGEYPWVNEKIGIAHVPNPGMEHQTMVTFGDPFDFQQVYGQPYSPNLYHEFGHEWFANKVTNSDWTHMWIQEGIDTYTESFLFKEIGGEKAYDSIIAKFKKSIKNKQALVLRDHETEAAIYTGDIYTKGAFFMHSLKTVIGDDVFFKTLKELATNPKYTYDNTVTTDDVEQLFSMRSGKNLKPFFDFYLRTTNTLNVQVKKGRNGNYTILSSNAPIPLPVKVTTNSGIVEVLLEKNKPVSISSKTPPILDASKNYITDIDFK
ncbi:M1 family metallopeptidase [Bizionia myxarmorum]|uniref:Aminopeptidase N n=1 Tax=Bizionia myxarmorum TaxID=291186 RepID=A0A5D0RCX7_9FLAO|nr:M1 family metallopeptidase [Bizionia myxarmorum]TYB79387.1 M1 family metallopeptidase [Bizionia myxarmorum]